MRRLNPGTSSRRAREREGGEGLDPGAIVARAAATVPGGRSEEDRRVAPALRPDPAAAASADPPVRRNRRARRRLPGRMAAALRRHSAAAGRLVLLIALFGFPAWLWHSGRTDQAIALIDRGTGRIAAALDDALALRLEHLYVAGRHRTSRRALSAALDLERGVPLTRIDLPALRRRLRALPWVEDAAVERRWPNALHIRLQEFAAVARYAVDGRMKLVAHSGALIDMAAGAHRPDKLLIAGAGAPERAAALLALLRTRPILAKRVVLATRRGRRRWDLRFDNGAFLKLPERRPDAAWHRFADLERAHDLLARGALGFDMRSRFQFVIRTPDAVATDAARTTRPDSAGRAGRSGGRG